MHCRQSKEIKIAKNELSEAKIKKSSFKKKRLFKILMLRPRPRKREQARNF